jgi:predicted metal-dependent HD superfamily phosphohydrolase
MELSAELVRALQQAYGTPPRAYHHLGHIEEVLQWFDWVESQAPWRAPREVCTAVLFHDAMYVPGAGDNEVRSAAMAGSAIAQYLELEGIDADRVAQLILWTSRHGHLGADDVDPEAARFLDCDLAILAADPARYRRYRDRALPREVYHAGRRRFVTSLLARPRIFLSDLFYAEREGVARRNLQAEVDASDE